MCARTDVLLGQNGYKLTHKVEPGNNCSLNRLKETYWSVLLYNFTPSPSSPDNLCPWVTYGIDLSVMYQGY